MKLQRTPLNLQLKPNWTYLNNMKNFFTTSCKKFSGYSYNKIHRAYDSTSRYLKLCLILAVEERHHTDIWGAYRQHVLSYSVPSTTQVLPWRANYKKNMFSFHSSLKSLFPLILLNSNPSRFRVTCTLFCEIHCAVQWSHVEEWWATGSLRNNSGFYLKKIYFISVYCNTNTLLEQMSHVCTLT